MADESLPSYVEASSTPAPAYTANNNRPKPQALITEVKALDDEVKSCLKLFEEMYILVTQETILENGKDKSQDEVKSWRQTLDVIAMHNISSRKIDVC